MKATKFLKVLLPAVVVAFTIAACTNDSDYDTPTIVQTEPDVEVNTTISIVKAMDAGSVVDFSDQGPNLIFEGYVVSNDEAGNFYKTLVIQDKAENPTAAIQIDIDETTLYDLYKPGQKIYVNLSDPSLPALGMEEQNGVLHIGYISGSSVGRIPQSVYTKYIFRSTEVATLVPRVITPSQYDDSLINMLVQIDNMQLSSDEVGSPYANADDTYTVNRYLKNCEDDTETIIRNSGYATFKSYEFPTGMGSIVAVFSKYNSDYQLFIRDTDDVSFDGSRCDPLFEDSFADGNLVNWTTYSVTGSQQWTYSSYGNPNDSAYFTGYSGGNQVNEDWLISKAIDLSGVTTATLSFDNVKRYAGNALQLFMCTDYAGGNPNTSGTWVALTANWDTDTTSWYTWADSGDIDVSAAAGSTLFIAFKYTSTTSAAAAYELDNVKVNGQ